GDAIAGLKLVQKLDQRFFRIMLIVESGVQAIEQNNGQRCRQRRQVRLASRREVGKSIGNHSCSQRWKICRKTLGGLSREELDLLLLAFIEKFEIVLRKIANRFALLVMNDNVHLNKPRGYFDDRCLIGLRGACRNAYQTSG